MTNFAGRLDFVDVEPVGLELVLENDFVTDVTIDLVRSVAKVLEASSV